MKRDDEIERMVKDRRLRVVTLSTLHTDPTYQREVKPKHRKIIAEFDEDSLGLPLIGERSDGSLWIVDGQQRITALRKMGWVEVRADVFRSDGPVHEAQVFKRVNLDRTSLKPIEQFKSRLAAQDEVALNITAAVEAEGFKIGVPSGRASEEYNGSCIGAVNTLVSIYLKDGADPIRFALKVARMCWPNDRAAVSNKMLAGLAIFFERVEQTPDWERLTPRFQSVTVQRIVYAAGQATLGGTATTGGGGGDFAVADQLTKVYHKRCKPK